MIQENSLQQMRPLGLLVEAEGHLQQLGVGWRCLNGHMQVGPESEEGECQYVDLAGVVCAIGHAVVAVSHGRLNTSCRSRLVKELGSHKASLVVVGE